jgi:oligo-alginate lyase
MRCLVLFALLGMCVWSCLPAEAADHPKLLFQKEDIPRIRARARSQVLQPVAARLLEIAEAKLSAAPIRVSLTRRGEPDAPGEVKGIAAARALQGRVLTYCMAYLLTEDRRFRNAAVGELDNALTNWKIWVDTAHAPPYDLMTGENCLTFGLAYDWLYHDLSEAERSRLRQGAEERGLKAYLEGADRPQPMMWLKAKHNWNPVCNGGAAVLALALQEESSLSRQVLDLAVPALDIYWNYLADDGGWDEGTGYWDYGHRYGLLAAEALRRSGWKEGAAVFQREGVRNTCYFPLIFNPGTRLAAGFGDSNSRANDPIFYLLGREYRNPDFIWFQDRAQPAPLQREGWPREALKLLWRPADEDWLPEAQADFAPTIDPFSVFPSIGWGFMASGQPDPPFFLAFKNGSLAANHTHLDLNHLSVGVGDTMLAVELGSRPYPADYFSPNRYNYYEIGTAGHNTVLVGGRGQVHLRKGSLEAVRGAGFEALIGRADGAYEVPTPKARRHVVFVDRRYWVVLDEIETESPQTIELRFHTYGEVKGKDGVAWTLSEQAADLDIVALSGDRLEASAEQPEGWIRPVNVLSFKSARPAARHLIATVLHPRTAGQPGVAAVKADFGRRQTTISVGKDQVIFVASPDGWRVGSVRR